jgi:hypothetical protein
MTDAGRDIAEVAEKVSLINEPLAAPDGTVALPVLNREEPLHAQLCEVLVHTKEAVGAKSSLSDKS